MRCSRWLPISLRDSNLYGPDEVVLDLTGLERLFGGPQEIGEELCRAAAERQTASARRHCGHLHCGTPARAADPAKSVVVVEAGAEAIALAPLHLTLSKHCGERFSPHARTPGVSSACEGGLGHLVAPAFGVGASAPLGELAALPADARSCAIGRAAGHAWQRLARGEDPRPLRPEVPKERFEQALDLEWPIEGLEPLSFVLGRLLEPLSAHLERRGRGAAVLHVRLHLVTRTVHERSLQLPAPMRDARTFRTLLLLDLESHPPSAAIDRVVVAVDPTPARIVQFSLLTRPLPSPEQLSTLTARLAALMGEDRCGSPVVVDSWQPGAFAMKPFNPGSGIGDPESGGLPTRDVPDRVRCAVSVFPCSVRVRMEHDKPRARDDRSAGAH